MVAPGDPGRSCLHAGLCENRRVLPEAPGAGRRLELFRAIAGSARDGSVCALRARTLLSAAETASICEGAPETMHRYAPGVRPRVYPVGRGRPPGWLGRRDGGL